MDFCGLVYNATMKLVRCLVLFFLLSFLFVTPVFASVSVDTIRITSDGSQQSSPLIYPFHLAFNNLGDIWGYDHILKQNYPILEKPGLQYLTGLYQNLLVYEDVDDVTQSSDVRLYNMDTREDILVAGGLGSQGAGVTNGKVVVYIDGGACGPLYSYNIASRSTTKIVDLTCTPVRISGNIVVFPVTDPAGTNIKGYNLDHNSLFDIATDDNFQEVPNIYGSLVVWLDRRSGALGDYNAIKMKNLLTGEVKILYESSTDALNWPAVSPNYVIFSDSSAANIGGIKGVDLRTGEVFDARSQQSEQNSTIGTAAIWGSIAIWSSGGIYVASIKTTP